MRKTSFFNQQKLHSVTCTCKLEKSRKLINVKSRTRIPGKNDADLHTGKADQLKCNVFRFAACHDLKLLT
jgi:hypothetical protein